MPKQKVEDARASNLSDFKFPRASEGAPVPRIYGTVKFKAPNTTWAGDFQAVPIRKKQKTGLFSSKKVTVGYKYYIGLDLAICLGPNFVFKRVWAGKYELFNGCFFGAGCNNVVTVNRPEMFGGENKNGGFVGDIALYCGDFDQPQDSYLASRIDTGDSTDVIPNYGGVAHMVFRKCYWGNSPNIEPIYIEGSVFTNTLGLDNDHHIMPNGLDANAVEVLYDIYVNGWGNLDIDPTLIDVDQWRDVAEVVYNEGNGLSLEITNANTGADVSKEILRQIAATIFQNPQTGLFELVLVRNDYNIEDLPVFGPSQIKTVSNFTKKLWEETTNTVRVKFIDRDQGYKENTIAVAQDLANVRFQGRVRAIDISMPGVYVADNANQIAARELSQSNVPLYAADLTLDRTASQLKPGQPFVFTWPEYGIVQMVMRVRKFGLGTLKDGTITMSVVQDEFALDTVVTAPPAGTPVPNPDQSPKPLTPLIMEMPYWMRATAELPLDPDTANFAVLLKQPSNFSFGYNVITDLGAPEPAEALTEEAYTATAELAETFDRFAGFQMGLVEELLIKNVSDTDQFVTTNEEESREGWGLFYLNGELLTHETATDNGDGTWTLGNVRRAVADTGWVGGVVNDTLYFFEDQQGFLPDTYGAGQPELAFAGKFQDVTTQGAYPLEDALLVEEEIGNPPFDEDARSDKPLPPDAVKADDLARTTDLVKASGESVTFTWLERNRLTDPTLLKFEHDPTETPEDGTLYDVHVEDPSGNLIAVAFDLPTPEYELTFTDDMIGPSVVMVYAKRDGVISYAASPYPVTVTAASGNRFTEFDELRVTEDGEYRILEG